MTGKLIAYWVVTVLFCLSMAGAAAANVAGVEDMVKNLERLGFRPFVGRMLGIWELLGVGVLLAPGLLLVKEWAYAGFVFLLVGAVVTHAAAADPAVERLAPLMFLAMAMASWRCARSPGGSSRSRRRRSRPPRRDGDAGAVVVGALFEADLELVEAQLSQHAQEIGAGQPARLAARAAHEARRAQRVEILVAVTDSPNVAVDELDLAGEAEPVLGDRPAHVCVEVVGPQKEAVGGSGDGAQGLQRIGQVIEHARGDDDVVTLGRGLQVQLEIAAQKARARHPRTSLVTRQRKKHWMLASTATTCRAPARSIIAVWPPSIGPSSSTVAPSTPPRQRRPQPMRSSANWG